MRGQSVLFAEFFDPIAVGIRFLSDLKGRPGRDVIQNAGGGQLIVHGIFEALNLVKGRGDSSVLVIDELARRRPVHSHGAGVELNQINPKIQTRVVSFINGGAVSYSFYRKDKGRTCSKAASASGQLEIVGRV